MPMLMFFFCLDLGQISPANFGTHALALRQVYLEAHHSEGAAQTNELNLVGAITRCMLQTTT